MGPLAQAVSRIAVAKYVNVANKTGGVNTNGYYTKTLTSVQQAALQTTLQSNPIPNWANALFIDVDFQQPIINNRQSLKPTFDSLLATIQDNLFELFANSRFNGAATAALGVGRQPTDNFSDSDDINKKVDEIMARLGRSVKNFVKPLPQPQRAIFVTLFDQLADYVCRLLNWFTAVLNALIMLIPGRWLVLFLVQTMIDQLAILMTGEVFAQIMH